MIRYCFIHKNISSFLPAVGLEPFVRWRFTTYYRDQKKKKRAGNFCWEANLRDFFFFLFIFHFGCSNVHDGVWLGKHFIFILLFGDPRHYLFHSTSMNENSQKWKFSHIVELFLFRFQCIAVWLWMWMLIWIHVRRMNILLRISNTKRYQSVTKLNNKWKIAVD